MEVYITEFYISDKEFGDRSGVVRVTRDTLRTPEGCLNWRLRWLTDCGSKRAEMFVATWDEIFIQARTYLSTYSKK